MTISRHSTLKTINVSSVENSCTEIDMTQWAGGTILIPAARTVTLLTLKVAEKPGGTYLPLKDSAGVAVTVAVSAGNAFPVPVAAFGAAALKLISNQSAVEQIFVVVKG